MSLKKSLLFALALVLAAFASVPVAQATYDCPPYTVPANCIDPEGFCACKMQSPHLSCMKNCTTP